MSTQTSFQADIRPLFTERDITARSKAFNLANYDDVKAHAAAIYDRIRGIGGALMPPSPPRADGPWPQSRIELFAKWMADGCLPREDWVAEHHARAHPARLQRASFHANPNINHDWLAAQ